MNKAGGWEYAQLMTGSGRYKLSEDGKSWIVDEEANRLAAERTIRKHQLYWALRSRVLTNEEMLQVQQYDYHLVVDEGVPYTELEKRREFSDALAQQFRLRTIAVTHDKA